MIYIVASKLAMHEAKLDACRLVDVFSKPRKLLLARVAWGSSTHVRLRPSVAYSWSRQLAQGEQP